MRPLTFALLAYALATTGPAYAQQAQIDGSCPPGTYVPQGTVRYLAGDTGGYGGNVNSTGEQLWPYDAPEPWLRGYFQEIPAYQGYHSFRPYNYRHVLSQTQAAGGWGMEPTMAYSQQFWHRYEARAAMRKRSSDNDTQSQSIRGVTPHTPPAQLPRGNETRPQPKFYHSPQLPPNPSQRPTWPPTRQPVIPMGYAAPPATQLPARNSAPSTLTPAGPNGPAFPAP